VTIDPINAARLRCIGAGLYCILLSLVAFPPAFIAMVIGRLLLGFGNLWEAEATRAMARSDEARERLLRLEREARG
jgi:hypothetical protein